MPRIANCKFCSERGHKADSCSNLRCEIEDYINSFELTESPQVVLTMKFKTDFIKWTAERDYEIFNIKAVGRHEIVSILGKGISAKDKKVALRSMDSEIVFKKIETSVAAPVQSFVIPTIDTTISNRNTEEIWDSAANDKLQDMLKEMITEVAEEAVSDDESSVPYYDSVYDVSYGSEVDDTLHVVPQEAEEAAAKAMDEIINEADDESESDDDLSYLDDSDEDDEDDDVKYLEDDEEDDFESATDKAMKARFGAPEKAWTFDQYKNARRIKKADKTIPEEWKSNTNLAVNDASGNMEVYPGSFCFPEYEREFWLPRYVNKVFKQGKTESLTERHLPGSGPIIIDLDARYPLEKCADGETLSRKKHGLREKEVYWVVKQYQRLCMKYLRFNSEYECDNMLQAFVTMRPSPRKDIKKDGSGAIKDGAHIQFPYFRLPYNIQHFFRIKMIETATKKGFLSPRGNMQSMEDLFDEAVIDRNYWMLYGSTKSGTKPYNLVAIVDKDGNELKKTRDEIVKNPLQLVKTLSIQNTEIPIIDFKDNLDAEYVAFVESRKPKPTVIREVRTVVAQPEDTASNDSPIDINSLSDSNDDDSSDEFDKLLECIGDRRCCTGKYSEWIQVAGALKNELKDAAVGKFMNWTNKYGSDNKKMEAYQCITQNIKYVPEGEERRLTKASLHYWAKQDNPTEYRKLFNGNNDVMNLVKDVIDSNTDDAFAELFIKINNDSTKCTDIKNKTCFQYKAGTWIETEAGIEIKNEIQSTIRKVLEKAQAKMENSSRSDKDDKLKAIKKSIIKVRNQSTLTNIFNRVIERSFDSGLVDKLDRKKMYLPLKNGKKINLETMDITSRTKDDLFSYECNANYVEMEEDSPEFKFVDKYFDDLFCGNAETKQAMLDIIKSTLTGNTLRYIYFMTGSGCNGKSLLLKVLSTIFDKSVDTISKLIVVNQKGNFTSTISTELEKLTQCRLGVVSELSSNDTLNQTRIKEITGGDKIDYRGLFKANKTIIPTTNIFCATNELPSFKFEEAIMRRIITIPFNNVFSINPEFEDELNAHKDHIFSYIMKKGNICSNFNLSDEMIAHRDEYMQEQDSLQEFINETVDAAESDASFISVSQFKIEYDEWCKRNRKTCDIVAQSKLTRKLSNYTIEGKPITIKKSNGVRKIANASFKN